MNQIKVLLVDDKEIVREGLARILEEQRPINVISRCSSDQVIAILEQTVPDLILMDTDLSDQETTELILKVSRTAPKVRIAIITDSENEEKLFSSIEAGASGYLAKSLTIDDLVKSVDLIAKGRVVISDIFSKRFINKFSELRQKVEFIDATVQPNISEREVEILQLLVKGATNKEIAQRLFISENTAKVHVKNILQKLGLRNRQQAVAYAVKHGWVTEVSEAFEK